MFEAFGYLTHISGLPAASLFSHPAPRDETTARSTFYARTRLISRAVVANIFNVTSGGRARFYLDRSPDGDFDRPASFRDGTRIAAERMRFQTILNVQAPNSGIGLGSATTDRRLPRPSRWEGELTGSGARGCWSGSS